MSPFDPVQELGETPAASEQVWAVLRRFAGSWHAAIEPGEGCSDDELDAAERRLGVRLPAALQEGYALLGRRSDLVSRQDRLLAPDRLEVDETGDGGVLVFRYENQSVTRWGIPLAAAEPDPPVVWEVSRAVMWEQPGKDLPPADWREWPPWFDRVSLGFLEMVLSESWVSSPHNDILEMGPGSEAVLERHFSRLAVPPYPLWAAPEEPSPLWFGRQDVLGRYEAQGWMWVQARTPSALKSARDLFVAGRDT